MITPPCPSSISKKGYSGLARFKVPLEYIDEYPAPCDYSTYTFPANVRQQKYPFASTAKRKTFLPNSNPGPGIYNAVEKHSIIYDHCFGASLKMRLGVELKCCKRNTDMCNLCGKKTVGDYWHRNNKVFLCRPCMTKERSRNSKYLKLELAHFHKLRDCSEIHFHEGTDAKIWLMHPKEIRKWNRCEAYLTAYLKD